MASAQGAGTSVAVTEGAPTGLRLFSGTKLWFSRGVPQRDWLIQNAQLNGAEIVPLEKQADILLVDHARKNQPPGTTSYQFVERSIRKGALEDLSDHAVGLSTRVARPVGSVTTAPRGGRVPFTEAEDQFLWNVVELYRRKGGSWKGNKIYEQIEQMNPRHTYQSWRDHYIKVTRFQNRQLTEGFDLDAQTNVEERRTSPIRQPPRRLTPDIGRPETAIRVIIPRKKAEEATRATQSSQNEREISAGPSQRKRARDETDESTTVMPPPDQQDPAQQPSTPEEAAGKSQSLSPIMTPLSQRTSPRDRKLPVKLLQPFPYGFTDYWTKKLFHRTAHILDTDPQKWNKAWRGIAKANAEKGYSAQQWKDFWETVILPAYCKRRGMLVQDVPGAKYLGGNVNDGDADSDSENEEDGNGEVEEDEAEASTEERNGNVEQHQILGEEVLRRVEEDVVGQDLDRHAAERQDQHIREEGEHGDAHGQAVTIQEEVDESEAPSSPGVISCSKCFTTESLKWRRDREANLLCNDCGRFLKSSGILRPSDAQTIIGNEPEGESVNAEEQLSTPRPSDRRSSTMQPGVTAPTPNLAHAAVQTSPFVPSASPERRRHRSPSFEPDTPSGSRPPAANEARKRREGTSSKSNSQNTNKSSQNQPIESMPEPNSAVNFIEEEQRRRQRQLRLRSPTEPVAAPSSRKKKPRLQDDPNTLAVPEISQTPEHRLQATGSLDVANAQRSFNSPSPQDLKFQTLKSTTPHSPLFVAQDSDEEPEQEDTPTTTHQRHISSPIHVNLVSEDDHRNLPSSQQNQNQDDALSEADTASQYAFETAPDVSEDWETAPEGSLVQSRQGKMRIETQALWDITNQMGDNADAFEDEFTLPEPEGGWEAIEAGYEDADQEHEEEEEILDVDDLDTGEEYDELADLEDIKNRRPKGKAMFYDIEDTPEPATAARVKARIDAPLSPSSQSSYDTDSDEYDPCQTTSIDEWQRRITKLFQPQKEANDIDLDEICWAAICASSWDFTLATSVVERMLAACSSPSGSRRMREQGGAKINVPDDMAGCWTEEDDNLICSDDPRDWVMMEKKHGGEACDRRLGILEMWKRI